MPLCPKCGGDDWKPVTEQRQFIYKACGNCNYTPSLENAQPQEAGKWLEEMAAEHAALVEEAHAREQEVHDAAKPTTLQHGRLSKAKRLLAMSDKKMIIAEAMSEVVKDTESGQVTLIIPEVGMYQFEWGDFHLLRAIEKVQKDGRD